MSVSLPRGKLPSALLRRLVFGNLPMAKHPLHIASSKLGRANNIVLSVDPVAGVPIDSYGFFAVHYSASDVAVQGAKPRYLVLNICYPAGMRSEWLRRTARAIGAEARRYGIMVLGGHTGAYDGLRLPFISSTCIGYESVHPIGPEKISEGDKLLLAGRLCLESAWLAASVKPRVVERYLGSKAMKRIGGSMRDLTPLPNALAALGGTKCLHDVTEGGLAAALQELSHSARKTIIVEKDKLTFDEEGLRLITDLGEDPLSASSFGALLIVASPAQAKRLMTRKRKFRGPITICGHFRKGGTVQLLSEGRRIRLRPSRDIYQRFSKELPHQI